MDFGTAIGTCFRKTWTISGRASRSEYWWFFLFTILLNVGANIFDSMFAGIDRSFKPFAFIVLCVLFFPQITVFIRRLHDINYPAAGAVGLLLFTFGMSSMHIFSDFLGLVALPCALVGSLTCIVLAACAGDPGPNRFGPSPLASPLQADQVTPPPAS